MQEFVACFFFFCYFFLLCFRFCHVEFTNRLTRHVIFAPDSVSLFFTTRHAGSKEIIYSQLFSKKSPEQLH